MSFTAQELDLSCPKGDRFEGELEFLEPGKSKTPVDITRFAPTLVIEGVATLKLGEGLTRPTTNTLRIFLNGTQTSTTKSEAHWYLSFKEGSEAPETILKGTFEFPSK